MSFSSFFTSLRGKKNQYEEISDNINNDVNENNMNNDAYNPSVLPSKYASLRKAITIAMVIVVVASAVTVANISMVDKDSTTTTATTTASTTTTSSDTTTNNPFLSHLSQTKASSSSTTPSTCQYHPSSSNPATMIQTSLYQHNHRWSSIPCQSSSPPSSLLFPYSLLVSSPPPPQPTETTAGTATLRVDFSTIPFANSPAILGFGGAFTEATALNFNSLNEEGRSEAMKLLFGRDGLGYSLGRVHMNSCDFCVASYNFDDVDGDFDLEHFDEGVTHDVESGMIDLMLHADAMAREEWGDTDGVRIMASPWSPPPWMKAPTYNDPIGAEHAEAMIGSATPSCLREGTGPDSKYAQTWALFFSKFITAYKNRGINLWSVTVQNEPEFPAPWDACAYTTPVEDDFISYHLGPILRAQHPTVKLFAFDHNKDHAPTWMSSLLSATSLSRSYIDGTAIHWYAGGMDRLLDGAVGAANVHRLKALSGDEGLIVGSEACHCPSTGYAGGDVNVAWARAERYGHAILADLAAGSHGWIDWNMILDSIGGPNHVNNVCDAPILAVPHRATDNTPNTTIPPQMPFEHGGHPFGTPVGDGRSAEMLDAMGMPKSYLDVGLAVQPMYYYLGHITRYVRPGSRAVMGLVDGGRVFGVNGGGENNLARNGIEITTWPCEGSTRQLWKFNNEGQLQVFGHDWLGNPTTSCISRKPDESFQGLILTDCNSTDNNSGLFSMASVDTDDDDSSSSNLVRFVLQNDERDEDDDEEESCLFVKPLENHGGAYGPRGGAQVDVGPCDHDSALWLFDDVRGEISSLYFNDGVTNNIGENGDSNAVCLTTGWPFLQMGAFITPSGAKVIVVLNEADIEAKYMIKNGEIKVMTNSIGAHSIQTVLFD